MKHLTDEQLILYYYGEPTEDSQIGDHLASCSNCRLEYQKLQRSLAFVTADPVPERTADYGSRVWQQVQPQLGARRRFARAVLWPPRPRTWGGVMAALIIAAFLLGRYWPHQEIPLVVEQANPVSPPAREHVLLAALADHLEESQMVLMELTHAPEGGQVDIAADQELAREILKANRIYRQAAGRDGEAGLASVLDDLERILLEIVQSPSNVPSTQIDEMCLRIQAQGILFKLRILGSQVRERQNDAARELSRRSS